MSLQPVRERRILAVDDDPAVLDLIVTRLTLADYEVYYARDGREALARVRELRPAGLILDINMPELDGFGVLTALGQTGELARLPTMVLTARNQQGDVQRAVKMGARDFLAKPFNDKQLVMRVARLLRRPGAPAAPSPSASSAAAPDSAPQPLNQEATKPHDFLI